MANTKFWEEDILHKISRVAHSTVTARRFVKANATDHDECEPAGANAASLGVALNGGEAGVDIVVADDGVAMVDAGDTIALNDEIISDASGKAVPRGTAGSTLYRVRGRALAQAASGEQVPVKLADYSVMINPPLGSVGLADLTQRDLCEHQIPLSDAKVWDAPSTVIPATPASDDLGMVDNAFLTGKPTIETGDLKNAGATTRKTRFRVMVPRDYVAGETMTVRANAGMKTTVASVSATIDVQAVRPAAPTVDICATNAQSINSLVAANKDFTLTPTDLVPGEMLDIVVSIAVNDSGTGTAVIGQLNSLALLADSKP